MPYLHIHGALDKYCLYIILTGSLDTLQPAVFPSMWIRSGVSWLWWQFVEAAWCGCWGGPAFTSNSSLNLRCYFHRLLSSPEGLGLSPDAWVAYFLGECQWGSRHFWNHQVYVGYGPAPGSHYKKALYLTWAYMGHSTNTRSLLSYSLFYFCLPTGH